MKERKILIDKIRKKVNDLNVIILAKLKDKSDIKRSDILSTELAQWLRYQNALNMHQVCYAYYRGALFYSSDAYHFTNKQPRPEGEENFSSLTTLDSLSPILLYSHDKALKKDSNTIIGRTYKIRDGDKKPSITLETLLFSRTIFECMSAVQIAGYKTLLDLLRLIYGKNKGTAAFDQLFSAKENQEHDLNRLRLGVMGDIGNNFWDFAPLYFFTKGVIGTKLEDLKNSPENYIGIHFFVVSYDNDQHKKNYTDNAWNVIFVGLNENQDPLFLAACQLGQTYILTYDELLEKLKIELNSLPPFSGRKNKDHFYDIGDKTKFLGLLNSSVTFNMDHIALFLDNPKKAEEELNALCQKAYEKIQEQGYDTKPNSKPDSPWFTTCTGMSRATDDNELGKWILHHSKKNKKGSEIASSLRFFKAGHRPNHLQLMTKDDANLHIAYKARL